MHCHPTHTVAVEGYAAFELDSTRTLLEGCELAGVPMDSACGGFASCNACRVQVLAGLQHLNTASIEERAFLDAPDQRLGCQATVRGPVSVRLAPGT